MKMDPFIEAEEVAGHSVKHCCELFEVSRAAYYERKKDAPSAREVADAELTEKIIAVHTESKGTYGSPRVHQELVKRGVPCGRRRVRRLMRRAGLEGRCKKRWRKTTVPDPAAERAKDLIQRHFGPCTELDRRYVGDITYIMTWEGWSYLLVTWNHTVGFNGSPFHELRGRLRLVDWSGGEVAGVRPARASGGVARDLGGPRPGAEDDRRLCPWAC